MRPDNETELDFLNFTGVADTVAEVIVQAQGSPISIGVSGEWGVGKSSMIRFTRRSPSRKKGVEKAKNSCSESTDSVWRSSWRVQRFRYLVMVPIGLMG